MRDFVENVPNLRSRKNLHIGLTTSIAEEKTRTQLFNDSNWFADYRRLRIVAYKEIAHDTGKTARESRHYTAFNNRTIRGS
ncbi:MAG: hypothetical protein NVSMB49_05210 [Ktedonobacteraceae bacterium]